METLLDFVRMGGHGTFIWPSYLLAFLVLLANGLTARRRRRQALRQIAVRLTQTDSASSSANNGEST